MTPLIFLSYRRSDCQAASNALRLALEKRYGTDAVVFRDCDSLEWGKPWPDGLRAALTDSVVVLVLIGDGWDTDRLDDPEDWVRLEVEAGHEGGKLLPVLVNGADYPKARLRQLCPPEGGDLQALQLCHADGDGIDATRIFAGLEKRTDCGAELVRLAENTHANARAVQLLTRLSRFFPTELPETATKDFDTLAKRFDQFHVPVRATKDRLLSADPQDETDLDTPRYAAERVASVFNLKHEVVSWRVRNRGLLVILSGSGTGKTWHSVSLWLDAVAAWRQSYAGPCPVHCTARELTRFANPEDALPFPDTKFLVIDGYDEIGPEQQGRLRQWLAGRPAGSTVLFTRPEAYETGRFQDLKPEVWRLLPLDAENTTDEVEELIRRWFATIGNADADARCRTLGESTRRRARPPTCPHTVPGGLALPVLEWRIHARTSAGHPADIRYEVARSVFQGPPRARRQSEPTRRRGRRSAPVREEA